MITLATVGLDDFDSYLNKYGESARRAGVLAINDSVRKGRTQIKEDMLRQVALKSTYVDKRLKAARFAKTINDSGAIVGYDRATSLNRFLVNPAQMIKYRPGVPAQVQVAPGRVKNIPNAFTMRLKNGNLGLVIRTKDGVKGSKGAKQIGKGLYLLYGPSVVQVMQTTIEQNTRIQRAIGLNLQREFERQLVRLTNG